MPLQYEKQRHEALAASIGDDLNSRVPNRILSDAAKNVVSADASDSDGAEYDSDDVDVAAELADMRGESGATFAVEPNSHA